MSDELLLLLIVVCYQVVLTEKSKKFTNFFRYRLADGSCRHWSICTRRGRQWASSTLQGLDSSQGCHTSMHVASTQSLYATDANNQCTNLISICLRRLTYLLLVMMQQYLLLGAGRYLTCYLYYSNNWRANFQNSLSPLLVNFRMKAL